MTIVAIFLIVIFFSFIFPVGAKLVFLFSFFPIIVWLPFLIRNFLFKKNLYVAGILSIVLINIISLFFISLITKKISGGDGVGEVAVFLPFSILWIIFSAIVIIISIIKALRNSK